MSRRSRCSLAAGFGRLREIGGLLRVDRDVLVLQGSVAFAGLAVSYLLIVDRSVAFSELEVCHVLHAHDPVQHAAF